jgi:hypothetical protein
MKTIMLVIASVLTAGVSPGQGILANPFMNNNSPVPGGFTVDVAASSPVYGDMNVPVYAWTGLAVAGILQAGYSNEGYVGNVVGRVRACPGWDAKVQVLRHREGLSSVALWIRGTIGWQKEELGANDLRWNAPAGSFINALWTHYEFNSTAAGITVEPGLGEDIALNLSVGYRELDSRNLWIISMVFPGVGDTYHSPGSDRTSLLEGSANLMIRVMPQIAVIMQAGTLPYYKLNEFAQKLDLGRAYLGAIGVRYSMPIPVFVDGYVRWHSTYSGQTDTQIRLGLSSELNLN